MYFPCRRVDGETRFLFTLKAHEGREVPVEETGANGGRYKRKEAEVGEQPWKRPNGPAANKLSVCFLRHLTMLSRQAG